MNYNKDGEINRYFNLDEILNLDLPNKIREGIKEKFNKRVYYGYNDTCRLGILTGIEMNHKINEIYYIIDTGENKDYIPIWKSITRV